MGLLSDFKDKLVGVKNAVENWKADNPTASNLISKAIGALPEPFSTFGNIVWEGLEKNDNGAQRMLEILQKMENNNEEQFNTISGKIGELITNNATHEDIQNIGRQISKSEENIITIIEPRLNELKKLALNTNQRVKNLEEQLEKLTKSNEEKEKVNEYLIKQVKEMHGMLSLLLKQGNVPDGTEESTKKEDKDG